jgi:hypothetical protein
MQYNVGYHLDPTTFVWEKGPGYTFEDFRKSIDSENPAFQTIIKRPSDLFFTMSLLILILIYIVVIYLADNWFESNRGHPKNPFAFLVNLFKKTKKREMNTSQGISLLF